MKGWYGDRQKHSMASKGIRTVNITSRGIHKINLNPKFWSFMKDRERVLLMALYHYNSKEDKNIEFDVKKFPVWTSVNVDFEPLTLRSRKMRINYFVKEGLLEKSGDKYKFTQDGLEDMNYLVPLWKDVYLDKGKFSDE